MFLTVEPCSMSHRLTFSYNPNKDKFNILKYCKTMYQIEGCQQYGSSRCESILPDIFLRFIGKLKAKSVSERKKERKKQKREVSILGKLKYTKMGWEVNL
jgi:hypothetical protein